MGIKVRLAAAAALALVLAVPASAAIATAAPAKATTTTTTKTTRTTTATTATASGRVIPAAHLAPLVAHYATDAAPDASAPPTCWTQFAPTNPNGIEMAQYYRNCNGYAVDVFFGYTYQGSIYQVTTCGIFGDGGYTIYVHPSTVVGANYGTFFC